MNKKQLKKLMSSLDISQADLCRICFGQISQSDRVIVNRWLSGAKPIPRWLPQLLNYWQYAEASDKEALKLKPIKDLLKGV